MTYIGRMSFFDRNVQKRLRKKECNLSSSSNERVVSSKETKF
jgi:hypothetical protein